MKTTLILLEEPIIILDEKPKLGEGFFYAEEVMTWCEADEIGWNKIITQLETKNGIHLITKPFRVDILKESYFEIDIHKDNPINLYIP